MSDNHTALQQLTTTDDGWDAAASEEVSRSVRGTLMKFVDWRFYAGKQTTPIPDGMKLVALATVAMWQRWQGGKVAEIEHREPGKFLPARATLGHHDEALWEKDTRGAAKDPWANTRLVYLVHPVSAALYTSVLAVEAAAAPCPNSAPPLNACVRHTRMRSRSLSCVRKKCRPSMA
jgi:hypothetical protein